MNFVLGEGRYMHPSIELLDESNSEDVVPMVRTLFFSSILKKGLCP